MGALKGRVAIVTGAGRGIGKATALRLAREGIKVVAGDIDENAVMELQKEAEQEGLEILGSKMDVSSSEDVERVVSKTIERFGGIDILVNNAGICEEVEVENMTEKQWDRLMSINLKGTFLCSRAVIPYMKQKNYGKIVNLSSISAETGGVLSGAHYAASKAGIKAFTKKLSRELGPYNINVNSVAPGRILTEMIKPAGERNKKVEQELPLQRLGEPEEVAEVILFLVSKASDYLTGQCIHVNGGWYMN